MQVSKKYSSGKYLKAEDLQGREVRVQISHVEEDVEMGFVEKEKKDVLHFYNEGIKPLVLNTVNAKTLAQAFGDDSDGWGRADFYLFVEEETGMGPGIRIRVPSKPTKQNGKPYDEAVYDEANPPPHTAEDLDEIPY